MNDDFYNVAFWVSDKSRIQNTRVINNDNAYYGIEGGADTYDQVFLLSVDEILEYYDFNVYYTENKPDKNGYYDYGYCQVLITESTQYAKGQGVYAYTIGSDDYNN